MIATRRCIEGTLAAYQPRPDKPWDERRVRHLFNRISFGASPSEIQDALTKTPDQVIDELISRAEQFPLPTINEYPWAETSEYGPDDNTYQQMRFLSQLWIKGMLDEGVRHKLALFWSNHFVTESDVYGRHSTYLFQYYYILHLNAFGDFKKFVKDIGLTPAMLLYLNGNVNTEKRPNENYAREILELFTMGEGNYSQQDIEELSRALTGWKAQYYDRNLQKTIYVPTKFGEFRFVKTDHDYGEKTILGVTYTPDDDDDGFNDYDRVHDIIFEQRTQAIARYICEKIYRFYVYQDVDEDILLEMMNIFISSNWNIKSCANDLI